jgi:hypothetical protein
MTGEMKIGRGVESHEKGDRGTQMKRGHTLAKGGKRRRKQRETGRKQNVF